MNGGEDLEKYNAIWNQIKVTDEISFKLLGFVPLVSGAGIFVLLLKNEAGSWPSAVVALFSLFGAAVTFGLYCWERRNIQTCRWLQECAKIPETSLGFPSRQEAGNLLGLSLTKANGEAIVYTATILAWLSLGAVALMR